MTKIQKVEKDEPKAFAINTFIVTITSKHGFFDKEIESAIRQYSNTYDEEYQASDIKAIESSPTSKTTMEALLAKLNHWETWGDVNITNGAHSKEWRKGFARGIRQAIYELEGLKLLDAANPARRETNERK